MLETMEHLIGSVGFPIAITLWFMLRTEKVINKNTNIMTELLKRIQI